MTKKLTELVHKEVTRKQFLVILVGSLGSVLGLSAITGLLSKNDPASSDTGVDYGMLNYGP